MENKLSKPKIDRDKYITKFYDYRELPFGESINSLLFYAHRHKPELHKDDIVYKEEDVLILIQVAIEQTEAKYKDESTTHNTTA